MKIPSRVIAVVADALSQHYTHAEIDRQFLYADAPEEEFDGNKLAKVQHRLKVTNLRSDRPLVVLGKLLEDLLEADPNSETAAAGWNGGSWKAEVLKRQDRIASCLEQNGLKYTAGGQVSEFASSSTATLAEIVSRGGLAAIQIEIDRALKLVADDPNGAAHYAGNVLEATFKHYLTTKEIWFDEEAEKLNSLWQKVRDDLGINPKNLVAKDLLKITSGLNSVVDGTMYLRNKRSGSHGKSDEQERKARIRPRHARLAIHAAHTIAAYTLECLSDE